MPSLSAYRAPSPEPDEDGLSPVESDIRFVVDPAMDRALIDAWPAIKEQTDDGWLLRRSGGHTRRANAVYPLELGQYPMPKKVSVVEQFYLERRLRPMFRLTPASEPPELDTYLADRGYAQIGRTWVLGTGPIERHPVILAGEKAEGTLKLEATMSEDWFDRTNIWLGYEPEPPAVRRELLSRVCKKSLWATWLDPTGHITAAALVALHEPWAFVPFMVAEAEQWGRGHRIALLVAVMHRLHQRMPGKIRELAIEVEAKDELGKHLIESLSFEARYPTWYRARVFFTS